MSLETVRKRLDECPWTGAYAGGTPGVLTSETERLLWRVALTAHNLLQGMGLSQVPVLAAAGAGRCARGSSSSERSAPQSRQRTCMCSQAALSPR